jgi:hypothetical protein
MGSPSATAKTVFLEALEIASGEERQALLDTRCGSDFGLFPCDGCRFPDERDLQHFVHRLDHVDVQRVQHVTRSGLCGIADRRDPNRRRAHQAHERREAVELGRRHAWCSRRDDAARDLGGRFT